MLGFFVGEAKAAERARAPFGNWKGGKSGLRPGKQELEKLLTKKQFGVLVLKNMKEDHAMGLTNKNGCLT